MANFLFGAVFILGLFAVGAVWLRRKRRAERRQGLVLLQALRMMLKHLQLHRGLTAVFIAGDKSQLVELKSAARAVSQDLDNLATIDGERLAGENWRAISSHWARLSVAGDKHNIYDNYDQHSKLIYSLLEQIRALIYEYGLTVRGGAGDKIFWYEMLCMGEKLGQLRALGVICLSKGAGLQDNSRQASNAAGQEKVLRLCRTKVIDALAELEQMLKSRVLREKFGEAAYAKVKNFVALAEREIGENQLMLDARNYFLQASEAIDLVYEILDEEMQSLIRE